MNYATRNMTGSTQMPNLAGCANIRQLHDHFAVRTGDGTIVKVAASRPDIALALARDIEPGPAPSKPTAPWKGAKRAVRQEYLLDVLEGTFRGILPHVERMVTREVRCVLIARTLARAENCLRD